MFVFELALIVNIILKNLSVLSLSINLIVFIKWVRNVLQHHSIVHKKEKLSYTDGFSHLNAF